MKRFFQIAEYAGFAVVLTAFILGFNGITVWPYFLPGLSILGMMLLAWGIGGQAFK